MTTMTATETATETPLTEQVAAKTICLALRRTKFGNRKKASMSNVTVDADKTLLAMSKQLLDSPELKSIQKLDSEVQGYLKRVAFQSLFKGGVYLIPLAMVETVDAAMKEFEARRQALVDVAGAAYEQRTQETAARLDVVYVPTDYPSQAEFVSKFSFSWQYVTFDTPSRLKAISPALFEAEREKAAAKLSAVVDTCRDTLRAGLSEMVSRMVERLTPTSDGKPKIFHKTVVSNINEFLDTFALRNVTNDAELDAIVQQARGIVNGLDAKTLRDDDLTRQSVLSKFEGLQTSLETITVDRGTRAIEFDDDDEG